MSLKRRIFFPFNQIDLLRVGDLVLLHELNPELMFIHIVRLLASSFLWSKNIKANLLYFRTVLIRRGGSHTFVFELWKINIVRKVIEIFRDPVGPVSTCLPARALECRSSIRNRQLIDLFFRRARTVMAAIQ